MSDYDFSSDEAMTLAKGARSTQGGLFLANPCEMTDEDCAAIFENLIANKIGKENYE